MNKNIIILMLGMIFLVVLASNVNADITFWRDVSLNHNDSIVRNHGYYQYVDDSKSFLGKFKSIPVSIIYFWQDIPYNISQYYPQYSNASIDWCNLTIVHDSNQYSVLEGNLNSSAEEILNIYLTANSSGNSQTVFNLKHQDSLVIDFDCHYTNPNTLYIDHILFGDWDTYYPAFSCTGCEETKLEELTNEITYNEEQAVKEVAIYEKIQRIVKLNYNIWLYGSWAIKIGLIFVAISLIFLVGYMFYSIIESMARRT
jgi:hypothetical protein